MPKSWTPGSGSAGSTGGNPPSADDMKGEPQSVRDAYDAKQGRRR